jgi:hypothetical protein
VSKLGAGEPDGRDRRPIGLPCRLKGETAMSISPVFRFLVLAAATLVPLAKASPRDLKLCSATVQTCDCQRQLGSCVPVCQIEPLINCPSSTTVRF